MYKKCKIVLLPTKEKSAYNSVYIHMEGTKKQQLRLMHSSVVDSNNHHLYVLSDDKIEEGDWYLDTFNNSIIKANPNSDHKQYISACKKIIATTNTSLGLPQPSKSFIDKYIAEYNKGNKIEDVMVEYEATYFKRIIDMMESQSAKEILKISSDNTITIKKIKDSFTRADIIHAFTSGHNKAKDGLTHANALLQYKIEQQL